jgi:hypothetical protein
MAQAKAQGRRAGKGGTSGRSGRAALTARTADRHALYQQSVQEPDADLDFLDRVFRAHFGRLPARLREDFCGTAYTATRWVQRRAGNTCVGIDLDPDPIAWGRRHLDSKLTDDQRGRLRVLQEDVLSARAVKEGPFDAVFALNFSYWVFTQRAVMLDYFGKVRRALGRQGLFVLDHMAGSDVLVESVDKTRKRGFSYHWDQASYDPLTGAMRCHIHFHFPDGSKLSPAFTYDWRLWTLPELKDILREAGFGTVESYVEGEDKRGRGTGVYVKRERCEADRCVLSYLVARG